MAETLEAKYSNKIKESNFRAGQFVKIVRKLTDEQVAHWPWGHKILEKYIGLSRRITDEHNLGFMIEGSDYVFPFEMLEIHGKRVITAPYQPKQKGKLFEYFTGVQIIDQSTALINGSSGSYYNIYCDNTDKELRDISFGFNNNVIYINEKILFIEDIHYMASSGKRLMEYIASK